MPREWPRRFGRWFREVWPELVLGAAACLIFLGCLGALELWGKREQRAAAEALDTIEHGRWLIAEIQGRPRLEKPPLPRWTISALLALTGARDERVVRLPGALSGLAAVALVYALGRRMGGRELGLAAAAVLCSLGLFLTEVRQAGNDGPLAFFLTLALYSAWRRLHGDSPARADRGARGPDGSRGWVWMFHAALGLGFLCKGPIILVLAGVALIPYVLADRGGWRGLARLTDAVGVLLFLGLAACWPVPVLLTDPNAFGVWWTEMGQKTGFLPIAHRERMVLGAALPLLSLPWAVLAFAGLIIPLVRNRRLELPWRNSSAWFAWSWSVGNLAVLSTWAVAKPSYFVPCMPGLALLAGMAWIRLSRAARDVAEPAASRLARGALGLQWLMLWALGMSVPLLGRSYLAAAPPPALLTIALTVCGCAALGRGIWRRGHDAAALLPIAGACAAVVLIGYGIVGPTDNPARGHRGVAGRLDRLAAAQSATFHFFHEIDEGLWFYLKRHRLRPVPGSQPRYSDSHDKVASLVQPERPTAGSTARSVQRQTQRLLDWIRREGANEPYLLIRTPLYDHLASHLAGLTTPLYRETALHRTGLTLLRVRPAAVAQASEALSGRN